MDLTDVTDIVISYPFNPLHPLTDKTPIGSGNTYPEPNTTRSGLRIYGNNPPISPFNKGGTKLLPFVERE
jgi:hypothetical protein